MPIQRNHLERLGQRVDVMYAAGDRHIHRKQLGLEARSCNASTLPWTAWAGVGGTCNAVLRDTTGTWSVPLARQCQTVSSAYADAASCAVTTPDASGNFTECQYNFAAAAATQTCAPAYVANDYTNPTVYRNCGTSNSTWANATTCTEDNELQRVGHQDNLSVYGLVQLGHRRDMHPGCPV